jgi:polyhydroxybutyrate depolymerase
MSRVRKFITVVLSSLALVVAVFAVFAFWALQHTSPEKPELSGRIEPGELQHDGRSRSWIAYLPAQLAPHPALVIVLHGSMGSAQQARADAFGYDFDLLADRHGFIAVYPQGYDGEWNEAKVLGPYPPKAREHRRRRLLHALVQRREGATRIPRGSRHRRVQRRVDGVAAGVRRRRSSRAPAVVSASVPTAENMAVTPSGHAVSILLMNGTDDPINPWDGGDVVLWPVLPSRGRCAPCARASTASGDSRAPGGALTEGDVPDRDRQR